MVGCSGAGKSTFAETLARRTGLPLIHLDQEYWSAGWVERHSHDEWLIRISELVQAERWIIDGNYSASFPLRLNRATAVLWLDLTRTRCLLNIMRRLISNHGKVRSSSAPGCPERWDWEFIKFVWRWHGTSGPQLREILARAEYAELVRRFRSQRDAWLWLESQVS